MPSEAEELAELKSMFSSPTKNGPIPVNRRPPWDATPLRSRPSALVGLKPVTREPWAIDEDIYNRRFETRDVGIRAYTPRLSMPLGAGPMPPSCAHVCHHVAGWCACRSVAEDRYLDKTARTRQLSTSLVDYMCRFDNKYAEVIMLTTLPA